MLGSKGVLQAALIETSKTAMTTRKKTLLLIIFQNSSVHSSLTKEGEGHRSVDLQKLGTPRDGSRSQYAMGSWWESRKSVHFYGSGFCHLPEGFSSYLGFYWFKIVCLNRLHENLMKRKATNKGPEPKTEPKPALEHGSEHIYMHIPKPECFDDAVDSSALPGLVEEASLLWKHGGGCRQRAQSYWIPRDSKPRCLLECLALQILNLHRDAIETQTRAEKSREKDRQMQGQQNDDGGDEDEDENCRILGAEIWVQKRTPSDGEKAGLELHFDKDEKALEEYGIWSHPALATATYLTDGGAPLLVLSTCSDGGMDDDDDSTIASDDGSAPCGYDNDNDSCYSGGSEARNTVSDSDVSSRLQYSWLSAPCARRHVAFSGNQLHGVPAELLNLVKLRTKDEERQQYQERISVLVNLWTSHQPEGIGLLPVGAAKICPIIRGQGIQFNKNTPVLSRKLKKFGAVVAPQHKLSLIAQQEVPKQSINKGNKRVKTSDQQDTDDIMFLKDHVEGDTGPLPVRAVQALLTKYNNYRSSDTADAFYLAVAQTGVLEVCYTH